MKRLPSLFLSVLLLAALGIPASAAGSSTDQRLAQVTAKVKKTLEIGDEYTEFYGELRENELAPVWSLNWSRQEDSISVTATESGVVLSYNFSVEDGTQIYRGQEFPPTFPAMSRDQAQRSAEAFLDKVLDSPLETAIFNQQSSSSMNTETYRFSGTIALNGLKAPLSFSLSVRASDGKVTRFHRDSLESSVIGGIPSAKPASGKADAGALLKDTLSMRLEYVLNKDRSTASLRYLPESGDTYYVDAQTGELMNLTELYKLVAGEEEGATMAGGGAAAPEAAAEKNSADTFNGLSLAEQAGIAKLEGVLPKEELDAKLQEITALGLDKYTLASASYSLNRETDDVTASLVYTRRDGGSVWRRTISCDGRTGALLSVYSFSPYEENRKASITAKEAQETAEAFLADLWGAEYSVSALYKNTPWENSSSRASHTFLYAQQENGYFLPENTLNIAVDITDGSISGLSRQWTENVIFDSPEGILDENAALDAWFGHYDTALAYRSVPVKLDLSWDEEPLADALIKMGHSYFYALKLTYALEEPENRIYTGVDAKTGEIVFDDFSYGEPSITYDDLDGHWIKPYAETLAQYGVGWMGGSCQPDRELSQVDLLALLASADGYRYDPETGDVDGLYRWSYGLGILTPADRRDDQLMTRGEVVKLLLDGSGYGSVAKLQGIFTCSYDDQDSIPDELFGYAALAQGLGLVNGSFGAVRTATRAEAAMLLHNLMNR